MEPWVFGLTLLAVAVGVAIGVLVNRRRSPDLNEAVQTLVAVAGEQLGAARRADADTMDHTQQVIDAELRRLGASLSEVTSLVQRLESDRANQFGQVHEQLRSVARQHGELAQTTASLKAAFSSSQTRGQWGERLAVDVLRAAGFVEGVNYRTQVTTRTGTRPDVTFLLPSDKVVHMDVKFPLGRYLDMLETASTTDEAKARTDFLRAVRDRVKEIEDRGYIDPANGTLDCVLLFIPNEQVYAFVHEHDPQLLDDALAQKVVLCSPSTLFAVLAVIRQAVDRFALEQTSDEILALLAGFADQWSRFTDGMDRLGRGLASTQNAFEALSTTRRSQLEKQLEAIEELRRHRGVNSQILTPVHRTQEAADGDQDATGEQRDAELGSRSVAAS